MLPSASLDLLMPVAASLGLLGALIVLRYHNLCSDWTENFSVDSAEQLAMSYLDKGKLISPKRENVIRFAAERLLNLTLFEQEHSSSYLSMKPASKAE